MMWRARMELSRRSLFAGAGAIGLVGLPARGAQAGVGTQAAAQPYGLADFFQPGGTVGVGLSPSGTRIAALQEIGTFEKPHGVIDIIDASDSEGPRRRIDLGEIEIQSIEWASDRRLLVRVFIENRVDGRAPTGSNMRAQDYVIRSRRIVSFDVENGTSTILFNDDRRAMRRNFDLGTVIDLLPNDTDHVLMLARESDGVLGLHKVNINDGTAERIERGNSGTFFWHTQGGVPVLRRDINSRGTMETLYARAQGETEWRFVRRSRVVDAPDFAWVGETERPGVVLVSARAGGEDVEAVRELDLHTLAFGAPMNAREGRDVIYGLTDSAGKYLGAAYYGDRLEYAFAEPALAAHHRALNRFFEDDCDVHLTDVDNSRGRFVAYAIGPREPGSWFFYDSAARVVANIGSRRDLAMERLGASETLKVATRDGATVEAYLTAPPTGRPGPLVVLPHGGPELRDYRAFNRQVQVLAAQGWWVLQANFRGSGGYGLGFAQQGWKRWGDRMQEDIEDAAALAISTKGLDADRVAIMGTSYGGYAALMGAVRRPDLYKAAISICGVGDLIDMLEWEKRQDDTPGAQIVDFWTKRIGDPVADRMMLEAASPRRRAAEIACPILLVHGADDGVVPVVQSHRMRDALRGARKEVEYVEIRDFGHADWEEPQQKVLTERYVALLRRVFA
jgi:dipeptidyl aminopeptidase/acylaminoacyl peptidase